jgi:outer membrane lipoprotein-sorting protein
MFAVRASSDTLPATTAAALISDIRAAGLPGFSGTLVAQLSLGLPELPSVAGGPAASSPQSLMSGSHTMRFWYGGPDRQRVALFGETSETDVFHFGTDVWQWDSDTRIATHSVLPSAEARPLTPVPTSAASLTPQELAGRALAALDPSTTVAVSRGREVADRPAYELVLTPRTSGTRVGSVHIEVDGDQKVPLGVQVYPRGSSSAALDVSFTSITFNTPSDEYFQFSPPPGATVRDGARPAPAAGADRSAAPGVETTGGGWTTIAEYRTTPAQSAALARPFGPALRAVSGSWGTGRLLESPLLCVLVTQDGRVLAGAVDPSALYAAAAGLK